MNPTRTPTHPEAAAEAAASSIPGGNVNPTDTEVLATIREIVEEYAEKANANIPTYVLVDALEGKL